MPRHDTDEIMTNSISMKNLLPLRCDKSHVHQQLVGGRCRDAAFYPLPLVEAIREGIALTADSKAKRSASLIAREAMEEEQTSAINAVTKAAGTIPVDSKGKPPTTSSIKKVSGGVLPIAYHSNQFKARYIDEHTGEVLVMAQAAMMEELRNLNDRQG